MTKIIYIIFFINLYFTISCQSNQIWKYNKILKDYECLNCPENCITCSLNDDIIKCNICHNEFYLDNNNNCKQCYKHCEYCNGNKFKDCTKINVNYVYNALKNKIDKCKDECLECNVNQECISCNNNYYVSKTYLNNDNIKIKVDCVRCPINNCEFCEYNNKTFECNFCNKGYSLVNNSCIKCQKNCNYCYSNINNCDKCKDGYFKDEITNICIKIKIENCYILKNNICVKCNVGYYLTKDKKCKNIQKEIINCSEAKYIKDLKCSYCILKYYIKDNKCIRCNSNCDVCKNNNCLLCSKDYFSENGKCKKCNIDNCLSCANNNQCNNCKFGYYFDKKDIKCYKCNEHCNSCNGPNENNCLSCNLFSYLWEDEKIIYFKNKNFNNNLYNNKQISVKIPTNQIIIEKICLSECPKTYKGKKVTVDYNNKLCIIDKSTSQTNFSTTKVNHNKDTHYLIEKLYSEYSNKISKEKLNLKNNYSKECSYNGIWKKILNSYNYSYFICYCNELYIGQNCDIHISMYKSINLKLIEILEIIENKIKNNSNKIYNELTVLKSLFRFYLSKSVIYKLIHIIELNIKHEKNIVARKELYYIFDNIIISLYNLLEDNKKNLKNNLNFDMSQDDELYDMINHTKNSILDCFKNYYNFSHISKNNIEFDVFNLNSFEIKETIMNTSNLYTIKNPFIRNIQGNINLNNSIDFEPRFISNYFFQIISFSSELYDNLVKNKKKYFITNLIMLNLIDNDKVLSISNFKKPKFLILNLYLKSLPVSSNLKDILQCSILRNKKLLIKGFIYKIIEEENRIVCVYEILIVELNDLFVVIANNLPNYKLNSYITNLRNSYEKFLSKINIPIIIIAIIFIFN